MGKAEAMHSAYQVASRTLFGNSLALELIATVGLRIIVTLVLLHAAPKNAQVMIEALKFQSQSLDGLPTMSMINAAPSTSLASRFAQAKKAAVDVKVEKCTVLGVDVEMERGENGNKPIVYSSFAHTFVLAIGREGWRVFQSWGEHAYKLDEYLERDGVRLRGRKEAKAFLKAFLVLATAEICGKKGPQKPVVRIYRPWVRFFEVEDVKDFDVEKFAWD